ncbi:MAG: hypothetical protein AB7F40_09865 [Victivallaceae bacterium]|nr:hypothetical protein [Victivallaceae bacterium]
MSSVTEVKAAATSLADTLYILTEVWGHENLTTVDAATGYYFADTEKTRNVDADDDSCWIAVACNGLQWGGWVSTGDSSITSEDEFFDYCVSCWAYNDGGYDQALFSWWLSGETGVYGFATTSGGGKFPDLEPTDYYATANMVGSSSVNSLISYLECGYFVTLGVRTTGVSHVISCWGYEVVDGNVYVYYSDSDDGEVYGSDRTQAANELHKSILTYDKRTMRYYLSDYFYSGIYVDSITAIAQYDSIMSGVHETLADAREIAADPDGEVIRRGKIDGQNDDDYYKLTGSGRGACFTLYTFSSESPSLTITMYDSEGNYDSSVEDTTGCIGTYTTGGGDYYYVEITGSAVTSSTSLTVNMYQFVVEYDKWWVGWEAIPDSDSEKVNVLTEIQNVYIGENSSFLDDTSSYHVAALVGNDTPYRIVYGGVSSGALSGDIRLSLDETTIYFLYGGGASGTTVDGSVYLQLDNETTVKSVLIAGGESDISGGIYLNVISASGTGNYFSGASNADVAGDIVSVYSDGLFNGLIYGGSRANDGTASSGDVSLTVNGAMSQINNIKLIAQGSTAWLVGGGQAIYGGVLTCDAVTVSISGGAALNNVVGGAHAEGANAAATVGSVAITIAGATISGNVYGGGYVNDLGVSTVSGAVSITIDSTENLVSIYGNIYAGGANPQRSSGGTALVSGGASITFSGYGDKLSFSGSVSGDGAVSGTVSGARSFAFDNFYGDFTGQIRDFTMLEVTDSLVTLSKEIVVDKAVFKLTTAVAGAMLTAQQFLFDSLDVKLDADLFTTGGAEYTLFTAGNASGMDDSLSVDIYDTADKYLGSVELGGGSLNVDGGSLGLFWNGNSLNLLLTA